MPALTPDDELPLGSDVHSAVRRGTVVVASCQVATQLVAVAILAVLYHQLGPQPYGYLGMVLPWILFLRIFASLGLNVAAVQKSSLSKSELDALFWAQQLSGFITFLLTAAGAPWLAMIYGVPELVPVVLALSATTLLVSLGATHQALMERHLRMTRLSLLRLVAQIVGGGSAVLAALTGWGVWALVVQQYSELVFLGVGTWLLEPWRPRFPQRIGSMGELLRFGGYWTVSSFILNLGQCLDKVLLGIWVAASPNGLAAVGMYTQAFQLMMKPVYLVTSPLSQIMLPALSRARSQPESYASLLHGFYRMVAIVLFPCGIGLAIIGTDIMHVLGGDRWSTAGRILSLLAPAIVVLGFVNLLGTVFASASRTDRLLQASVVVTVTLLLALVVGLTLGAHWGPPGTGPVMGLAVTYSVTMWMIAIPYILFAWNSVGVSVSGLLAALRGPLLATIVMGIVLGILRTGMTHTLLLSPALRLVTFLIVGILVYVSVARQEIHWLRQQLSGKPGMD